MGSGIEHDPITGEPIMPTEDLSNVKLDPVLEYKLSEQDFQRRQQVMRQVPQYAAAMNEKNHPDNKNKDAKALSYTSVILWILSHVMFFSIVIGLDSISDGVVGGFALLIVLFMPTAYILMGIACKKFPHNRFAKAWGIVYVIEIAFVIFIARLIARVF